MYRYQSQLHGSLYRGVSNYVGSPNDNRGDTDKSVRQILNQVVIHPRVPHLCVRTNL